jgi:hypothetical protein
MGVSLRFSASAVFFFSLAGCSEPSSIDSLLSAPAATGITPGLAKLKGAPLWNVESVGTIRNAWESNTFRISERARIAIIGWAVDQYAKSSAGGLELAIDDKAYAAKYGFPREDVARAYGLAAYSGSGFSFELNAAEFAPGKHSLFFRVISNNRTAYWEAGPYTLVLD